MTLVYHSFSALYGFHRSFPQPVLSALIQPILTSHFLKWSSLNEDPVSASSLFKEFYIGKLNWITPVTSAVWKKRGDTGKGFVRESISDGGWENHTSEMQMLEMGTGHLWKRASIAWIQLIWVFAENRLRGKVHLQYLCGFS